MVEPVESIVKQALLLPEPDRAVLIRQLIESMEPGVEQLAEVEQAWAEEIVRRIDRMERGVANLIPGDEVRRNIRKLMDERVG